MPASTKKKGPSRPRTRKPTIPAESPNGQEPVEEEWATAESIDTKGYRDEVLPIMDRKVRIRFLTNIEATQLALLPDLRTFADLMAQLETGKQALTKEEDRELRLEKMTYLIRVAHLAVVDRNRRQVEEPCEYCEGMEHLPSLWTPAQVKYLHPTDLGVIGTIAEQGFELERVRPLSKGQTQRPTSEPASTGESTPE